MQSLLIGNHPDYQLHLKGVKLPLTGSKPMKSRHIHAIAYACAVATCPAKVTASELVYTPVNPSFGGNPFNSAHLLGVATAQNKYKDPSAVNSSDPASQFLRTLQSRLLSSLATQITDVIFGENAQDSGLIRFGEQEISFVRGIDSVTLTITNNADGTTTVIVVPLLDSGTPGLGG